MFRRTCDWARAAELVGSLSDATNVALVSLLPPLWQKIARTAYLSLVKGVFPIGRHIDNYLHNPTFSKKISGNKENGDKEYEYASKGFYDLIQTIFSALSLASDIVRVWTQTGDKAAEEDTLSKVLQVASVYTNVASLLLLRYVEISNIPTRAKPNKSHRRSKDEEFGVTQELLGLRR